MPWQVGIDEAGYGPNLGPFVMTLVACQVPQSLYDGDLWDVMKTSVRRAEGRSDGRLIVADSKQVYTRANGLKELERTALSALGGGLSRRHATFENLIEHLAKADLPTLRQECWFVGDTMLPAENDAPALASDMDRWRTASESAGVTWGFCQSVVVPAPRFNDVIDRWDSKAAVLGMAVTDLMRACVGATAAEPMRCVIDKHGGRDRYSALLQQAFADGLVWAEEEGRARSVYRVENLDRRVQVVVTPRADVENFTVALASIISKYVRELLMREFNRFWQKHVPDLKPTAGYPLDAVRYIEAIRPAMARLGIVERCVWRKR